MKRLALVALLLALAAPRAVFAQVDRATVSGSIKDAGGAVLPGATVTVTNLATNVATQQTTTETGSYLVVNLIPGKYRIDVELSRLQEAVADRHLGGRTAGACRHVARSGQLRRNGERRRGLADPQDERGVARQRHPRDSGRQPAAGDPELGRSARARPWRAGRPLHRAGRRHVVRPHRRHQRARRPRPAEQLPPRRRGQQQHLGERPGADVAGVAPVGGRDPGVQGRDEPVLGGVRPVSGRRGQRLDEIGDEPHPGHRLRVLPQRVDGLDRLLHQACGRGQARK